MIISRTPFRISFLGGMSDYPEWYDKNGGAVLGTTIDKYCYIMVRYLPPVYKNKYRIVYRNEEFVDTIDEIQHPSIRECIRWYEIKDGLEVIHWSDLPARKGMGTSSAFTVGMVNALHRLTESGDCDPYQLAGTATYIERNVLGECVGDQDQMFAAFGGFNEFKFGTGGTTVEVKPVDYWGIRELPRYLMLFDTGGQRVASDISKTIKFDDSIKQLPVLVKTGRAYLEKKDYAGFGRLLNEAWYIKRGVSKSISNPGIDDIYRRGMSAGAYGGKLLGAGDSGYFLFCAEPENQDAIREEVGLKEVKFNFSQEGSKVVYNDGIH